MHPLCARHGAKGFMSIISSNLPRSTGRQDSHFTDVKTDKQRRGTGEWLSLGCELRLTI